MVALEGTKTSMKKMKVLKVVASVATEGEDNPKVEEK